MSGWSWIQTDWGRHRGRAHLQAALIEGVEEEVAERERRGQERQHVRRDVRDRELVDLLRNYQRLAESEPQPWREICIFSARLGDSPERRKLHFLVPGCIDAE